MNTYFDKELLQQSSIFELRNIARDMGVYSPTIYKKEELIEKIFQIVNGEVKPHVPKSRQGRPPKSLSSPSRKSVFDSILPTEEKTYTVEPFKMPTLSESVRAFLEDDKVLVKTNFDIAGTLEITPYGYGFIRDVGKVYTAFSGTYVSQKLIESKKLKNGDYLVGKAKLVEEGKPYVLYEVISTNNGVISQGQFEDLLNTYSLTRLYIGEEIDNFLVGSANLIVQDKVNESSALDYLKELEDRYTILSVKLEANKEQELIQSKVENENYYTTLLQSPSENICMVKHALIRAQRLASEGKDVVLCVDSIDKLIKNQNSTYNNNLLDIKSNTLDIVKQLAMAVRQLSKIGSLTIVGLYNCKQGNAFDEAILAELSDLFTKQFIIKN